MRYNKGIYIVMYTISKKLFKQLQYRLLKNEAEILQKQINCHIFCSFQKIVYFTMVNLYGSSGNVTDVTTAEQRRFTGARIGEGVDEKVDKMLDEKTPATFKNEKVKSRGPRFENRPISPGLWGRDESHFFYRVAGPGTRKDTLFIHAEN
jgi:hypothetical protein